VDAHVRCPRGMSVNTRNVSTIYIYIYIYRRRLYRIEMYLDVTRSPVRYCSQIGRGADITRGRECSLGKRVGNVVYEISVVVMGVSVTKLRTNHRQRSRGVNVAAVLYVKRIRHKPIFVYQSVYCPPSRRFTIDECVTVFTVVTNVPPDREVDIFARADYSRFPTAYIRNRRR